MLITNKAISLSSFMARVADFKVVVLSIMFPIPRGRLQRKRTMQQKQVQSGLYYRSEMHMEVIVNHPGNS